LRDSWRAEARAGGVLDVDDEGRLIHHWSGGALVVNEEKGFDGNSIKEIAEAIGPCPWVCSVKIEGYTHARSRQKAILAARVGIATIALGWNQPSLQAAQTGLLYDTGLTRNRTTVMFNGSIFVGTNHEKLVRTGRFLLHADADAFLRNVDTPSRVIGAALNSYLAVTSESPKRKMEELLCNAMIWFDEACNEPLAFLGIVKFAAVLDTLAKGHLVQRRYPVSDMDAPFLTDGTTARKLVQQIYETGRSQIVHGSKSELIDDLDSLRGRAEFLATQMLRACIAWLESHSGPDDPDAFSAI
jgi:hypothetical protein